MREEQRVIARNTVDRFRETLTQLLSSARFAVTPEVAASIPKAEQCESQYREGTVFAYRNAAPVAEASHRQARDQTLKVLDQRMAANRSGLNRLQTSQRNEAQLLFRGRVSAECNGRVSHSVGERDAAVCLS